MEEKNRMMKAGKETNVRKVLSIGPVSTPKTLLCLATFVMYLSFYITFPQSFVSDFFSFSPR